MLPRHADVVIIGAGVIGAAVAYYLGKEKIHALVLEKEQIGSGSSGACEGLLLLQSKKPGIHLEMAIESLRRFQTLSRELEIPIEYENKGGLVVIESEEELAAMQQFVDKQKRHGVDISLLSQAQARQTEPVLSEKIVGATFSPRDSQVNPILLTRAFLHAAQKTGTTVFTNMPVLGIESAHGRVATVLTEKGRVETGVVVNATGASAAAICRMVNLHLPIKPRRGQILVTQAVAPMLQRCILSARYIAVKFEPGLETVGGIGFAVEQTASGNILIGSTREFAGFDRRVTYEGLYRIASRILRVIPGLKNLLVIRAFAGLRPYTPDGLPILGKVESLDGFIMAAGHEGDGITLAPITGEMIARLIAGSKPPFAFDEFRLERFNPPEIN